MFSNARFLTAALLVSLVAMGVVSGANAESFKAGKYPAEIAATQSGGSVKWSFAGGIRTMECEGTNMAATLAAESAELAYTPSFENCYSNGLKSVPVTVTVNECSWRLSALGRVASLTCPTGKKMEFHFYESAAKHSKNEPMCTYDVSPQNNFGGNWTSKIDNILTTTEDLTISYELKDVTAESTLGSKFSCGATSPAHVKVTVGGVQTHTGSWSGFHVPFWIG